MSSRNSAQDGDTTTETNTNNPYQPKSERRVARYNGPALEDMTEEQRGIRDAIIKSRPRTGISGPFGPWIAVPSIAKPSQELGRACRYGTTLSMKESEMVILLTGAKTNCPTEFDLHVGEALVAGWTMEIIEAIPQNKEFSVEAVEKRLIPLLAGQDEKSAYDRNVAIVMFATELLATSTVSEETYAATRAALSGDKDDQNSDRVLVEITSIIGYYTYVAYTLNVFNIPAVLPK